MDLKNILIRDGSKETAIQIANWIGYDQERMDQLMALFFDTSKRMNQRAAYPLLFITDDNPQMFTPYLERMVEHLDSEVHDAVIRNSLRLFQFINIPEDLEGILFDKCILFLSSPKYPVAIRVFSMTILANLCKKYPDLKVELLPLLKDILEITESPGMISRGKKTLRELNRL